MKKLIAMVLIWYWTTGVCISLGYTQSLQSKEDFTGKQAKAEIATDSDQYTIGPEDVLYIHVWKEEALSKTITVRIDGKISLPLINEVQAAGQTPLQLKEGLTKRFGDFLDSPNVSVMVMEANSFKVFITGQIKKPGVYRLRNETTLIQLISMAEGFTEWANQKEIIIIRKVKGHETRLSVNYKKIISGEDLESNILLKSGDTIIIQ